MKYHYIAVTVMQDRNENFLTGRTSPEANPGYYSYVVKCSENDNIIAKLNYIGGLQTANIFTTKKRAEEVASYWNERYKANGKYLFDIAVKEVPA